jgi:peroxiredoxin Q/BCP
MLEEGNSAPEFDLPADDGSRIRLESLTGAPVVIYFYPRDDTSGCTAEAKGFTCLAGDFARAGAVVIGISPDSAASHRKFKEKHDLAVALLADEAHAVCEAYGVWAEKSMYGRTYMGVERSTFLVDPKGRLARIWRKVKVPGHAEEVLQAVQALAAK